MATEAERATCEWTACRKRSWVLICQHVSEHGFCTGPQLSAKGRVECLPTVLRDVNSRDRLVLDARDCFYLIGFEIDDSQSGDCCDA